MKNSLPALLLVIFLASCSSKYGITSVEAYKQKSVAGTIRVDRDGNPAGSGITRQHLLYVETDTSRPLPTWGTVWVEHQAFSVQPVEITQLGQVIGKNKEGKEVVIGPKPGNRMWQLLLSPKNDSVSENSALKRKIGKNPVVITGTWKNKAFAYKITKEEELETVEMQ
jgi:hypothetical protein